MTCAGGSGLGQQLLDNHLRLLVFAFAEVVMPDQPAGVGEVDGRPVVIVESTPYRIVIVDRDRTRVPRPQGPGKVAIRPVYPMTPHRGPAPRDCVGPGREPDSSDRHGRTYGADRDFAGALAPPRTSQGSLLPHRLGLALGRGQGWGGPLDADLRQPAKPAWQVPVPLAE